MQWLEEKLFVLLRLLGGSENAPYIPIPKGRGFTAHLIIFAIKVTSQPSRKNDPYDIVLNDWQKAGLPKKSVARVSKIRILSGKNFGKKIGKLSEKDWEKVRETVKQQFIKMLSTGMP